MKKHVLFLYGGCLALCIGFVLCAHLDVSAYPSGWSSGYYAAILRDGNGNPVKVGSTTPYSPKQTCGYGGVNGINCHVDMVKSYGLSSGNIYESDVRYATHDHGAGTTPYAVPYPLHGVAAAYHVQQGRNVPWGQVQRDFYQAPSVASSPGMFGLFCPTYNRQLADLNASDAPQFDQGSYDFGHSSCALCHAGGGPMEYDREGYRYDGKPGLFQGGFNPDPKPGDYYGYDATSGAIVNKASEWQSGGVAEMDCLICHLTLSVSRSGITQAECLSAGGTWRSDSSSCITPFRYSIIERNFALAEGKSPALAASLGLTGTSAINAFLSIPRKAGDGVNPDISQSGWSWTANYQVNGDEVWFDGALAAVPEKETCALCHYADKSYTAPGPVGKPVGYTAFQKIIPAGTAVDGDRAGGGTNAVDWKVSINRAGSRNNGESINDPLNPDAHMDAGRNCTFCHYLLGTPRNARTDCLTCHYDFYGYPSPPPVTPVSPQVFPALTDASDRIIQPAVEVFRVDHQLAKGNNKPYGVNMDQLDNTVTCENCHITRTHPNAGAAPDPAAAHAGFPAFHFDRIDCRSCHIPMLNFVEKQTLVDFSAGSYQAGERGQYRSDPEGIQLRPLYIVRPTNHDGSGLKIKPTTTLVAAAWLEGNATSPIFPRLAQAAAEARRTASGDGNGDGWYDWPLNSPQGGDTSLIVNTPAEISDMVSRLQGAGVSTPVMNFSIDAYSVSHNIAPRSSGTILGSPAGGGCVMCHASSDPASPNYSAKAAGFFDKIYTLFNQPDDGGNGLVQTELGGIKRVVIQLKAQRLNGITETLDLSKSNGETVANTLRQGDVLGYTASSSPYTLSYMTDPTAAGVAKPAASFSWSADAAVSRKVVFDASATTCPSGSCTYSWNFGDGAGTASGVTTSYTYAAAGTYTVTLAVTDTMSGLSSVTTSSVAAKTINTAPTASATMSVSGMTVTVSDSSTDAVDPPSALRVTVTWGDGTSTTQAAGTTFPKTYAAAGNYTVTHAAVDTGGLSASAALPDLNGATPGNVTVPNRFSVSGSVVRADGSTPLSGVAIYLRQGTSTKYTGSTKTDGTYTVSNVAAGTYDVVPAKAGFTFTPATQTVTVGPDATGINFQSNQ